MSSSSFTRLEDVVVAEDFPDVDLALRRGQHIDRDHGALYSFLIEAQDFLEAFYRRYGCELIQSADGFFYLLPTGDRLGRRHLSPGEMLVGQALTLLYLDPSTVQQGGQVTRDQLLGYLAGLMGTESLLRMFNPKRRRFDERVAEESVRAKVGEALRRLAGLGFVDLGQDGQMRLRPALMRFAEPVRGSAAPEVALERLVAKGELVLATAEEEEPQEDSAEPEDEEEVDLDPAIYEPDFEPLDDEFGPAAARPADFDDDFQEPAEAPSSDEGSANGEQPLVDEWEGNDDSDPEGTDPGTFETEDDEPGSDR